MPVERITPMPRYIVATHKNLTELVLLVNDFMRAGYAPAGGIVVAGADYVYLQAMVME